MNSKHFPQHNAHDEDGHFDDRPPSKSMLKRESHDLQTLGRQLADMPASRLAEIGLPERLAEAIDTYKKTKAFEGKRRQLQFIGKVMREVDAGPLREAVAQFQLGQAHNTLALHEAEAWRAQLVSEDKDALNRWVSEYPETDVQQLRTLIRNARKDASLDPEKRNGRAYREIFQFIKKAQEAAKSSEPDSAWDEADEGDDE